MKTDDILNFMGRALPFLGAAASGNVPAVIALAAKEIGNAIGHPIDASKAAITHAVANATPEQFAALRQAENDFALKMRELGYKEATDLARIGAEDRKDARAMQVATRSKTPHVLAVMITLGFFGILIGMMGGWLNTSDNQALLIMLGALGAAWGAVVNFFFGSSNGSQTKDVLLANSTPVVGR